MSKKALEASSMSGKVYAVCAGKKRSVAKEYRAERGKK